MVRTVKALLTSNVVSKFTCAGSWFRRINIQSSANAASLHRINQSSLVHNLSARGIDEVCAAAHVSKEPRSKKASGVRVESDVDTNDICGSGNVLRCGFVFHTHPDCRFRSQASAPRHHRHPERPRARDHFLTDLAHAHQTKRATKQAARF